MQDNFNLDDEATSVGSADTVEFEPVPAEPVAVESFFEHGVEIAATTHRGKVRDTNEDQYVVLRRMRSAVILSSSIAPGRLLTDEDFTWLLAVADGLGGHASGEVASAAAINAILKFASGLSSWIMRAAETDAADLVKRANLYADAIQLELQQRVASNPELAGMATTLTAALVSARYSAAGWTK